ncbi:MAG: hypothetical protein EOP86_16075 [Verrucomicrobiaceae bacterium]|nr:MAG: hypothetical protein EOP86_16075 [Verrucomicrobiaceae bacterium]
MPSPSLLDRCERRFGHLAIPGLLRLIAGLQALCFILVSLNPDFREFLTFSPAAWRNGEIWRFFTFPFIPFDSSLIWIFFATWILFRINDGLEEVWGKFRLNLYCMANLAAMWVALLTFTPLEMAGALSPLAGLMFSTSMFLAFATVLPEYIFLIFFVLPVKVKWLAVLDAAWLFYHFMGISFLRMPIVIALIPYACFGLPILLRNMRQKSQVAHRRAVYQENSVPVGEPFHECCICHRTDHTNPGLEFRIAGDDQEYCVEHLPQ